MGDDEALYRRMLKPILQDRNKTMANRIADKLERDESKVFFFAVGVMHYPGEGGILEILRKMQGFRVPFGLKKIPRLLVFQLDVDGVHGPPRPTASNGRTPRFPPKNIPYYCL